MPSKPHRFYSKKGHYRVERYPSSEVEPAISLVQVSKRYRIYNTNRDAIRSLISKEFRRSLKINYALNKVSFSLSTGCNLNLIGALGSGKSSILQLLAGNILPSSGTIVVSGKIVLAHLSTGGFDQKLNARDNLMARARMMGLPVKEAALIVSKALEFSGFGGLAKKPLFYVPREYVNRLAWGLYLSTDFDVILIDSSPSPTLGQDFCQKCNARIEELINDKNRSVIMTSRRPIRNLPFERCLILDDGKVVFEGSQEDGDKYYRSTKAIK